MKTLAAACGCILTSCAATHVHLPAALPPSAGQDARRIFVERYAPVAIENGRFGSKALLLASGLRVEAPEDLLPLLPSSSTTKSLVLMSEESKTQSMWAAGVLIAGLGIIAASIGAGFLHGFNVGNYDFLWATLVGSGVGAFISIAGAFSSSGLTVQSNSLRDAAFASYTQDYAKPKAAVTEVKSVTPAEQRASR